MKYYARDCGNYIELYLHCQGASGKVNCLTAVYYDEKDEATQRTDEDHSLSVQQIEALSDIQELEEPTYLTLIGEVNDWARVGTRPRRPVL